MVFTKNPDPKPKFLGCRVKEEIYEQFKAKLNGKTKQEILENLILKYLKCL